MVWGVGSPGPEETQFWHCGHSVNDSTTGVSLGASLEEGDHRDISDRRDGIQALLTQRTDEPRCRKARLPSGEFLLANGRPQSESAPGQAPVPPALRSDAGPGLQQPYQPLQLTGGSGSLQLRFLSRSVLPIRYGLCLHHRLCNPFPVGESLLQRSEVSVFRLNLTRGKALTARWQVTSPAGRPGLPYLQTEAPRPAEGRGRWVWGIGGSPGVQTGLVLSQEENSNTDHNTDGPGKHCAQ
ncbi:uncharacterized protein LOC126964097 [Macaca thibetana thibetana]|uniref:uncharacterized protein LOC126964097 n=1 Tax=Macaca thibetana thibetana TaxID=257877 RepID=UPI0021BCC011|nr:uncharacterized protein LOC126964097 [Macaca thibetana thibetana]